MLWDLWHLCTIDGMRERNHEWTRPKPEMTNTCRISAIQSLLSENHRVGEANSQMINKPHYFHPNGQGWGYAHPSTFAQPIRSSAGSPSSCYAWKVALRDSPAIAGEFGGLVSDSEPQDLVVRKSELGNIRGKWRGKCIPEEEEEPNLEREPGRNWQRDSTHWVHFVIRIISKT